MSPLDPSYQVLNEDIRLSIQRALLGIVTENLFEVRFHVQSDEVRIEFGFYNRPREPEIEDAEVLGSEVAADFNNLFVQVDCKQALKQNPDGNWTYVFQRK